MQYSFFSHLFLEDLQGFSRGVVVVGLDLSDHLFIAGLRRHVSCFSLATADGAASGDRRRYHRALTSDKLEQ